MVDWGLSIGAVVAREGGLISATLAARISLIGSVLGELIDPPELNAEETLMLQGYRTDRDIEEIRGKIRSIEDRLLEMGKVLGVEKLEEDNVCGGQD